MHRVVRVIIIVLFLQAFYCCTFPWNEKKNLQKEYSADVINYVYNSVYINDNHFPKRFHDILVAAEGDLWRNDSLYIEDAFEQINALELGFLIKWADGNIAPDWVLHFGDTTSLTEKFGNFTDFNFLGQVSFETNNDTVRVAPILFNNSGTIYSKVDSTLANRIRQSVIIHELLHAMGFLSHNLDDPESGLFLPKNLKCKLSQRDKEALQFWYHPIFPYYYSKQDFENDFREVLFNVSTRSKIIKYCLDNNIKTEVLHQIKENCFKDNKLQKFPPNVFVSLKTPEMGYDELKKVIHYINENVNYLTLIDNNNLFIKPEAPLINIELKVDSSLTTKRMIGAKTETINLNEITYNAIGTLKLFYQNDTLLVDHFLEEFLLNSVSGILGVGIYGENITQKDSINNIQVTPQTLEVLNLLHNPVLPAGMDLEVFQAAIDVLERFEEKSPESNEVDSISPVS